MPALDLNTDGQINLADLAAFSEYWLAQVDCGEPSTGTAPAGPNL